MPGKSSCCGYCSGNNIVLATRSTIFDDHPYLISQTTAEYEPILQKLHHGAPRCCSVIVHSIYPSSSSAHDRHWSRQPCGSPEEGADQAFCFTGGGRSGSPDPGCEKNWDGLTTLKRKFSQIGNNCNYLCCISKRRINTNLVKNKKGFTYHIFSHSCPTNSPFAHRSRPRTRQARFVFSRFNFSCG